MPSIVHLDLEGEPLGIVSDNEHRPRGNVAGRYDAVEIDEGKAAFTGEPQADIVSVEWVGTAIPIVENSIRIEAIIVRATRNGGDR